MKPNPTGPRTPSAALAAIRARYRGETDPRVTRSPAHRELAARRRAGEAETGA